MLLHYTIMVRHVLCFENTVFKTKQVGAFCTIFLRNSVLYVIHNIMQNRLFCILLCYFKYYYYYALSSILCIMHTMHRMIGVMIGLGLIFQKVVAIPDKYMP